MRAGAGRPRKNAAPVVVYTLPPEVATKLVTMCTTLYVMPYDMMARAFEDDRLFLKPEEKEGVRAALDMGVEAYAPQLGAKLPAIMLGIGLAAPLVFRADLIYSGFSKLKARKRILALPKKETTK